jgi:hypothetical protein
LRVSLPSEQPPAAKRKGLLLRGFWPALTLLLVVLSPWTIGTDLHDASMKAKEEAMHGVTRPFAVYMHETVDAQLVQLGKVNPMGLGLDFYDALEHSDCTWYFWCKANSGASASTRKSAPSPSSANVQPNAVYSDAAERGREMAMAPTAPQPQIKLPPSVHFHELPQGTGQQPTGVDAGESPSSIASAAHAPDPLSSLPGNLKKAADPQAANNSQEPLSIGSWPLVLPTWRSIRGTPFALIKTVGAIRFAGYWAIGMFLSCTLIWVMLLLRAARGETPVIVYPMTIGAPVFVPLMVACLQWLCQGALRFGLGGGLIAAGLFSLAPSTALALAVGLHHLYKVPGEAIEGVEKLKSLV